MAPTDVRDIGNPDIYDKEGYVPHQEIDDADLFVEIVDTWLEAWTRLSDASTLLPLLDRATPPGDLWDRVLADINRTVALMRRFDALGEQVFMADNSPRRKLMLDIGGTLRVELVEKLTACTAEWSAVAQRWEDTV